MTENQGKNLRLEQLRIALGFATKRSFAQKLNIHETYYAQIENGNKNITIT